MIEFRLFEYVAEVVRVVDGDTIDLIVDLGFRVKVKDRFRVLGIDTPERGQLGYVAATAYVRAVLGVGETVMIRTHLDQTDKYGRMLAEVYFLDPDYLDPASTVYVDLSADLIAKGLAKPYMV